MMLPWGYPLVSAVFAALRARARCRPFRPQRSARAVLLNIYLLELLLNHLDLGVAICKRAMNLSTVHRASYTSTYTYSTGA